MEEKMEVHYKERRLRWKKRILVLDASILLTILDDEKRGGQPYYISWCFLTFEPKTALYRRDLIKNALMLLLDRDESIPDELIIERLQLLWLRGYIVITNQLAWQQQTKFEDPLFELRSHAWDSLPHIRKLNFRVTEEGRKLINKYDPNDILL